MITPLLASVEDLAVLTELEATDPALQLALERASGRFTAAVGYPVIRVDNDTIHLDGNGTQTLLLPAAPVIGTPTVRVNGAIVTDYQIARRNGILRRPRGCWPEGLENIEITYSHGYDDIPPAIQDAVLEQAATQALVHAHLQQEGAGSLQATYGAAATVGTTQKWIDAVNAYRLRTHV